MAVAVKICGLSEAPTLAAAVAGGAGWIGLVFFPPSPRAVGLDQARSLAAQVPPGIGKVGLFVDADDALIGGAVAAAGLDLIQLHGSETPRRIAEIKSRFARPVMKAIKLALPEDLAVIAEIEPVADWLLFDAKIAGAALPGGMGVAFDWTLLAGRRFQRPWMLSGGLTPDNLAEAVAATGARAVDVSSGVESAPGKKDVGLIRAFLDGARGLPGP